MENVTKALLIAAAVLITIVLIAAGVLVIRNVSDTSEQAQKVGNSIDLATGNATSDAIGGLKGTIISKKKFNSFINDFNEKYSSAEGFIDTILNEQNVKLSNQIEIVGYVYQDNYNKLYNKDMPNELKELLKKFDRKNQQNNKDIFDYEINIWIPSLAESRKIIQLNDPLSHGERRDALRGVFRKLYKAETGIELTEDELDKMIKKRNIVASVKWSFAFDEWGYINKAVYISTIHYK